MNESVARGFGMPFDMDVSTEGSIKSKDQLAHLLGQGFEKSQVRWSDSSQRWEPVNLSRHSCYGSGDNGYDLFHC